MNTQLKKKINKYAAKEESKIEKRNLPTHAIRELLYDYDYELLVAIQKLHNRRNVDDLLNRALYRKATLPYGGLDRILLIDQFTESLGKCLACIKVLEDAGYYDETLERLTGDWSLILNQIEHGVFDFTWLSELFDKL